MAYVPGYNYDIFISFAHGDNDTFPGMSGGWVDQFHEQLENWLARRRDLEGLRIWRDQELHGNTDFDLAIENKIDSTALFFVLHSRVYRKSNYCRKELQWFNTKYKDSLLVGEHRRVFNILLNNFPPSGWPQGLENAMGFHMHDAEGEELGDFTFPRESGFVKQMRKVVDAAEVTLNAMRAHQEVAQPNPATAAPLANQSLPRVFIAAVPDAQEDLRERLINEIGETARIFDEVPPPWECGAHKEQVQSALEKADLSIHLLGQWPGNKIQDRKETTYPREQTDIALAKSVRQLIWLPEELEIEKIENPAYRTWVQALGEGEREKADIELVRCDLNALIELIRVRIADAGKQPVVSQGDATFLIDTHQKDQLYAFQLAGLLAEQGANVDINKESLDPVQSLALFEQAVRQTENLVILFGQVNGSWLTNRVRIAVKVMAEQFSAGESCILEHLWIMLLPGSQGIPPDLRLPPMIKMTPLDNIGSDSVEPENVASLLTLTDERGEQ